MEEVFAFIGRHLTLTKSDWISNSKLLRLLLSQKKLLEYVKNKQTGS
jgi:hypothetical protein